MTELGYRDYDEGALGKLVVYLLTLQGTPSKQLGRADEVVARQLAATPYLNLIGRALGQGMSFSETLDLVANQLARLNVEAEKAFRSRVTEDAERAREAHAAGSQTNEQLSVSASGQAYNLSVWAGQMVRMIVRTRVNAVPQSVRVKAGIAALTLLNIRWLRRISRRACLVGEPILTQVFVGREDYATHATILRRVRRLLGIDQLSEHEQDLWLGRRGFMPFVGNPREDSAACTLGRAWWPEIRRLRGLRLLRRKAKAPSVVQTWDLRDRPDDVTWRHAPSEPDEPVGKIIGLMVFEVGTWRFDEHIIPGDIFRVGPDDERWRIIDLEAVLEGERSGWFCRIEPITG